MFADPYSDPCVCLFVCLSEARALQPKRLGGSEPNLVCALAGCLGGVLTRKIRNSNFRKKRNREKPFLGSTVPRLGAIFSATKKKFHKTAIGRPPKYHKLSNKPIFTSIFEKMEEEIDFS